MSSDLLTTTLLGAGISDPAARQRVIAVLAQDFVEDQFARLEEAGSEANERVRLGQIFVDLRGGPEGSGLDREDANAPAVLERLLRPPTVDAQEPPVVEDNAHAFARSGRRLLVVGGPGQGKSTVTQHLVQGHRAALLRPHREGLDEVAREALDHDERERLPEHAPVVARFPLVVTLVSFAAWCVKHAARGEVGAIVRYLAERWRGALTVEVLEALLAKTPWLLVFDGLDEVSSPSDRAHMMACIEGFLRAQSEGVADEVVVATTRPQTWGGEFGGFVVVHLCALTREEAIAYATAIARARFPLRPRQQEKVVQRVELASQDPASAQLMRTPLLAAIMVRLIGATGQVPRLRWDLFLSFYTTLYDRELERGTRLSSVLNDQRPVIDELHRHVGLVLQARSEGEGSREPAVARAWLEAAVRKFMEADDKPREVREREARELFDAVEQRLVLLVNRTGDTFSYELRSFQEFMAAWALTTGADADVEARLRQIAPHMAWRNTLLLALGRLFQERSHLREKMALGLCDWLDDAKENPAWAAVKTGARLALDVLCDGLAVHSARVQVGLAERAMGVLDRGDASEARRLVSAVLGLRGAVDADVVGALRGPVVERLSVDVGAMGVWYVAEALATEEVGIADHMEVAWRRCTHDERMEMARRAWAWAAQRVFERWVEYPVDAVLDLYDRLNPWEPLGGFDRSLLEVLRLMARARPRQYWSLRSPRGEVTVLGTRRVASTIAETLRGEATHRSWRVVERAMSFAASADYATLAHALRALVDEGMLEEAKSIAHGLPDALRACLACLESPASLSTVVAALNEGGFGLEADWQQARAVVRLPRDLDACATDLLAGKVTGIDWIALPFESGGATTQFLFDRLLQGARSATGVRQRHLGDLLWAFVDRTSLDFAIRIDDSNLEWMRQVAPLGARSMFQLAALTRADVTHPPWGKLFSDSTLLHGEAMPAPMAWVEDLAAHLRGGSSPAEVIVCLAHAHYFEFDLPMGTVAPDAFERADLRACAAVVRLRSRDCDDEITALVAQLVSPSWDARPLLLQHLAYPTAYPHRASRVALALLATDLTPAQRRDALRVLRHKLRGSAASVDAPETWRRLGLAEPTPADTIAPPVATSPSAAPSPDFVETPVVFEHVKLTSLRPIGQLDLPDLPAPPADRGQWIVLLGENGAGKTTFLRALALTLTHRNNAATVLSTATADYIRFHETTGGCVARVNGADHRLSLRKRDGGGEEFVPNGPQKSLPWVVAYGCRRGGALGGRDGERVRTEFSDIATLFDEHHGLLDLEAWLNQQRAAGDDPVAKVAHAAVVAVLEKVIRHTVLPTRRDGVWLRNEAGEEVKLSALSDGYLTTAGWIADLLVRYVERRISLGGAATLTADFHLHMTGIVLLDEIDQQLHPRWQVRVLGEIRELFPKMTFVVTTHNPLTLVGARKGEIFVLRDAGAGSFRAEPVLFDPRLRTGTELYERFFGIDGMYPDALGRDVQRYGVLASNPYRSDAEDEELQAIIERLRREEVRPTFAPEPRIEGR